MVASQNGWRANDRSVIATKTVPGTDRRLAVRADAPGDLLMEVAAAFHRLVEPVTGGILDDWGYAERQIRGGVSLSNHASGTAIDLNATRHPLGRVGTFNDGQVAQIRHIIAATGNVVRWGGDYFGRKDEMHFEINDGQSMDDCVRALNAMRHFNGGGTPAPLPPVPAPAPPPTKRRVNQEDIEMFIETPEPEAGTPKNKWPTKRFSYGFDPAGGWGGNCVLKVHFGPRGGWIHTARWWVRDKNQWSANRPIHYPKDHSIGPNGSERFVGYGWETPVEAGADEIELEVSAPDGVHIFTVYQK